MRRGFLKLVESLIDREARGFLAERFLVAVTTIDEIERPSEEIPKEFIEAVVGWQMLVEVAEVVLPILRGRVSNTRAPGERYFAA